VKNVPLSVTGYYTTLQNAGGLKNSVRVSFDAQAYRQHLRQNCRVSTGRLQDSLAGLAHVTQKYQQHLLYLKYLQSLSPEQYRKQLDLSHQRAYEDSLKSAHAHLPDSVKAEIPSTTVLPSVPVFRLPSGEHYKDSLESLITRQQNLIDSVSSVVAVLKKQIAHTDSLLNDVRTPSASLPGNPFLSKVQTLSIGLCYPSFSPFLLSGVPLRGCQVEMQSGKNYFAAAAGKTVSNLMLSPDLIRNNLNSVRNLYNFFDFNQLASGRSIAAVKAGRGTKEGTHLFAGLLFGKGLESYWPDSVSSMLNTGRQEKNLVADIDAKFVFSPSQSISIDYAKSVILPALSHSEDSVSQNVKWLDYHYRSHAVLAKYEGAFPKLRSSVTVSFRLVDPYFRSFGAGFVRQDNIRYEIRTQHQVSKKLQLSFSLRREANNLLRLYDQFTVLQMAGVSASLKLTRNMQLRASYNPVFQQVKENGQIIYTNNNQIAIASVNYKLHGRKWNSLFTGLYSYYKLYDGNENRTYSNVLASFMSQCRKGWTFALQGAGYSVSPSDTLFSNSIVCTAAAGHKWKNGLQLQGNAEYAFTSLYGNHAGYGLDVEIPLYKTTALSLTAKKIAPGDFYNSFSSQVYKRFPCFCSAQLIVNW
ncbi:MAG TPA: hypothetical protein VFU15_06050, partial [Bacteroidia bacterium]|nr:hypothetical protein [Bacteroidia bacterium]